MRLYGQVTPASGGQELTELHYPAFFNKHFRRNCHNGNNSTQELARYLCFALCDHREKGV